jgi:hypothetical protein
VNINTLKPPIGALAGLLLMVLGWPKNIEKHIKSLKNHRKTLKNHRKTIELQKNHRKT